MPIKGLSEVRRLPRIGKLRLGIKETSTKSGNEYPKAVDYFVCVPDQTTSEAAAAAFHQVYGDKPRALDIMFPVEDRDIFFAQWYRRYGSGTGLLCKGDGETAMEIDRETGEIREIECVPEECEWVAKKHCRPVGTLQFLLYKVPGLGVWQIDTSSYHSIVNLNSGIDFVRALTGGKVAMIPLKLIVRPQEVQVEGRKKTVYVLDLVHETIRLEDILRASQKSVPGFLIPGANLDEMPDDLYPNSIQQAVDETPKTQETPKAPEVSQQTSTAPQKLQKQNKPQKSQTPAEAKRESVKNGNGTGFWTSFWTLTKSLNLTADQVHDLAGVESLKGFSQEWLQGFKSIFEAMRELQIDLEEVKVVRGASQISNWKPQEFRFFLEQLRDYAQARDTQETQEG